ncbi:MAG: ATP phosphoribosyltransferase regulatory subunit [Chromatocurvus sp.]
MTSELMGHDPGTDRWQLPDGVDELLPERAMALEALRRRLLDLYRGWGYQLVIPPLVEFTDSLLEGVGADLDTLTFKMPDQPSGRTLGIRADITPQVARIDAHSLAEEGVSRLCYTGSTLHARQKSLLASRSPVQAGAEIFGESALTADIEVIHLMLATLDAAGVEASGITLDLGHGDVCGRLLQCLSLGGPRESAVFDALQRKSRPDLLEALSGVASDTADALLALIDMHGGAEVLERAWAVLAPVAPGIDDALRTLREASAQIAAAHPEVRIYFDLAELRGYHYHTGIVFAAYVPGYGEAVANGGRYDNVGRAYGRARPATGFATDLKTLVQLPVSGPGPVPCIHAPVSSDPALLTAVRRLRETGEIVIASLAGEMDPRCSRELVQRDGEWTVQALDQH